MEYLHFEIDIRPFEGRSFEIIARCGAVSARQVAPFPLGAAALENRLPALRRALGAADLGAARSSSEDERALEDFAGLLYRFVFSGEIRRLFDEARAQAVADWKGLRLLLWVRGDDLAPVPWEVLWDILSFDLHSLKRGMFDLRVERDSQFHPVYPRRRQGVLQPSSVDERKTQAADLIRRADAAFYSPDFEKALHLYEAGLRLEPDQPQARECLARAQACLANREPNTTVPPRAAAGYRRAWDTFTMYHFDEALRWLNAAWLLAKDWGIAEWPEARAFLEQIERSRTGFANYQQALDCAAEGDLPGALEALAQAYRADPLHAYRAQLDAWGRAFELKQDPGKRLSTL